MKKNIQKVEKVRALLSDALSGVENRLHNWTEIPLSFTTESELAVFATKLREMSLSLDTGKTVEILGMWRIMETWPYKDQLRQKIVEAELAYEKFQK